MTHLMCVHNDALFFHAPSIAVDVGVQLMVPPLPALLANAASEEGGYEAPLTLSILVNHPACTTQTSKSKQDLGLDL